MLHIRHLNCIQNNTLIFGSSGSGKSTLQIKEIKKYCSMPLNNDQIIVIDPYGEYCKLAEQYKGQIISLKDQIYFPTFEINTSIDNFEQDSYVEGKVDQVIAFCEQVYGNLFDVSSKTVIKQKIFEVLKIEEGFFTIQDLCWLLKGIKDNEGIQILVNRLEQSCIKDNRVTSGSDYCRLKVYDLSMVPYMLKGAAYTVCLSEIAKMIKKNNCNNKKTRVFLDDPTTLFSQPGSVYITSDLWMRAKNYNSTFSAICNDVQSLLYAFPGWDILCNTKHVKILGSQAPDRSIYQKLYMLSDEKMIKLENLNRGNYIHVNFAGRIARKTLAFWGFGITAENQETTETSYEKSTIN